MFESNEPLHDDQVLEFGPYRLDRSSGALYRDGEEIPLPRKAIDVLTCFVERPNKTMSKSELMERVWSGTSVTDQSLIETIRHLRLALARGTAMVGSWLSIQIRTRQCSSILRPSS